MFDEPQQPGGSTNSSPASIGVAALAWRIAAFIIGLGLLAWCIRIAMSPQNKEQWRRLAEAPVSEIALLVGLTAASIVLNGLLFSVTIHPVRRLPLVRVQAVNAVAWVLNYLPLRLGLIFRMATHYRRDGLPFFVVSGWMAAVLVIICIGLGPAALASFWTSELNAAWWALSLGGTGVLAASCVLVSRGLSGARGWNFITGFVNTRLGSFGCALAASGRLDHARQGLVMLANWRWVGIACMLRLADLAILAGKFLAAGNMVNTPIRLDQAVHGAAAYFLVGTVAPTGELGAREAVTAQLFQQLHTADFSVAVLLVTAAETLVAIVLGLLGAMYLGPGIFSGTLRSDANHTDFRSVE